MEAPGCREELIVSAFCRTKAVLPSCHLRADFRVVPIDLQACLATLSAPPFPAPCPFCPLNLLSIKPGVNPHLLTPVSSPVVQPSSSGVQFQRTWGCIPRQPSTCPGHMPIMPALPGLYKWRMWHLSLLTPGDRGGKMFRLTLFPLATLAAQAEESPVQTPSTHLHSSHWCRPKPGPTISATSPLAMEKASLLSGSCWGLCGEGETVHTCLTFRSISWAPTFSWHSLPASTPFPSVTQYLSCCHIQSHSKPLPP